MADELDQIEEGAPDAPAPARRRRWRRWLAINLFVIAALLLVLWLSRETIVDRLVTGQLDAYDLPATYRIESVSPTRQVLRNLVIGDPARPDATVERLEIELAPRWNLLAPDISLRVVRPRLYGSYRGGKLSFGSLDRVLFTGSKELFRLPDWSLDLVDGRARLDTDYGQLGAKLDGSGALRNGFGGILAIAAPQLAGQGCTARDTSLFGKISITAERPRIEGPLRTGRVECPERGLSLASSALGLDARFDKDLKGFEAAFNLQSGALGWHGGRLTASSGTGKVTLRQGTINASWDVTGSGLVTRQAKAGTLSLEGRLRGDSGFTRFESEGTFAGRGIAAGPQSDRALADLEKSAEATPVGPLIAQLRRAFAAESRGSELGGSYVLRRSDSGYALIMPEARLTGRSGQSLLALSRVQVAMPDSATPSLSGFFVTGGPGMPRVTGSFERPPGGGTSARLALSEYAAGGAKLAMPELRIVQLPGGALGFAGRVRVTGPLPGGAVEALDLPLSGSWSPRRGLVALPGCTALRFDRFRLASLTLDRRALTLCAPRGGFLLSGGRLAGAAGSLDLVGAIGQSPLRIKTGPVRLALPGTIDARDVRVEAGPASAPNRVRIALLTARTTGVLGGHASGIDAGLFAVPLDLSQGESDWSFDGERLVLQNASFQLADRTADARFQPLIARDAVLTLRDNRIAAEALLREPKSDRAVVRAVITHDLAGGRGHADLLVDGIQFDKGLQPDTLTRRALGIVANMRGAVRGKGEIDWTPDGVTSTGRFTTEGLDFAAAFGPVRGTSGTVVFSDLLGLVTAPDQELKIAEINPGIAVADGTVRFELQPDGVLQVKGARWPFMDGTLELLPVRMVFGAAETRRYELVVQGASAAQFVQQMEMANISASGTFDGSIPVVFDENGGDIVDGYLQSRPPGGNLSYVGALTYEDLSPMANFAFQTLRSLDYRSMAVRMNGSLEGEIITQVTFDGVTQGAGAKRNFLTREIGKLPIRFNVNIRAQFFQLMRSFRSMYDPKAVIDPRELGLVDREGRPIANPTNPALSPPRPSPTPTPSPVQPSESAPLP